VPPAVKNPASPARPSGAAGPPRPSAAGRPTTGSNETVNPAPDAVERRARTQTIQEFVTLAIALQSQVEGSLPVLESFVGDALNVNTNRQLKCKEAPVCGYSLDDQTVTVKVGKNSKYEAFLSPTAKKRQQDLSGDRSFTLSPYTPALIGVGTAFVVLFGSNPKFTAVKSGDQFVIKQEDKNAVGYNIAAMLTITPKSWNEPTFGGQFQVGVSPTKDRFGLFVGGGIHVQKIFTFGGGFAWQQVDRLASGLAVDQTIPTADALKTATRFRPGAYVHITANIK
jgi:hypothetical protein